MYLDLKEFISITHRVDSMAGAHPNGEKAAITFTDMPRHKDVET
jgi:hypothetical protein